MIHDTEAEASIKFHYLHDRETGVLSIPHPGNQYGQVHTATAGIQALTGQPHVAGTFSYRLTSGCGLSGSSVPAAGSVRLRTPPQILTDLNQDNKGVAAQAQVGVHLAEQVTLAACNSWKSSPASEARRGRPPSARRASSFSGVMHKGPVLPGSRGTVQSLFDNSRRETMIAGNDDSWSTASGAVG